MSSGPLGLREHTGISQSALSKIEQVESLNLDRAKAAAVEKNEIAAQEVDDVELELRRFLALHVIVQDQSRSEVVAPSEKVDLLWHRFILETEDYVAFSNAIFGSYLHHRTDEDPADSEDIEDMLDEYFESWSSSIWDGVKARCCPRPCI